MIEKIDIENRFPNIYSALSDDEKDLQELRYFAVINENYEDIDDEEVDVFDPADYNYLVYITERVSNILGKDGLEKLYMTLDKLDVIENFLASEEDLYGVKSNLSEEDLGLEILKVVDKILGEKA